MSWGIDKCIAIAELHPCRLSGRKTVNGDLNRDWQVENELLPWSATAEVPLSPALLTGLLRCRADAAVCVCVCVRPARTV